MRVLIVEDDSMFNQFYSMYAEMQGDTYVAVTSLKAAHNALLEMAASPFDAVLLDNHLTDGQGLSLLPLLVEYSPTSAVIMVSANDDPEFFLTAFEQGVDDYAVKPVNMDLLWVKLRRSVQQRRLKMQAARQQKELEVWIDEEQKEQRLANHIFSSMTQHLQAEADFFRSLVYSSSTFCGDVVLRQKANDNSWYFLLADSMGHGLAAAVSLIPTLEVFQAMSRKALPLSNIVFELNQKLSRQLPADRFVAAVLIRLDPNRHCIEIWNGAMPPLLLIGHQNGQVHQVRSSNMALGILDDRQVEVSTERFDLRNYQYLIAYSDGVIESEMADGNELNPQLISNLWLEDAPSAFDGLKTIIDQFHRVHDDITAVELNLSLFSSHMQAQQQPVHCESAFTLNFCVRGANLQSTDLSGLVINVLSDAGVSQHVCGRAFAVLTELYLNAYEHGVLRLDSSIKQAEDGFVRYYEEKERRSGLLGLNDFVQLEVTWDSVAERLDIKVTDSGTGFIHGVKTTSDENFHGRGLQLVASLTTELSFNSSGNQIHVVMNG